MDITYLLDPAELREAMRTDVIEGLSVRPRTLPPKYFYDDRGSELFDEITRLPEYYPTNAERDLLRRYSAEIASRADATALLELGSGSSEKTRWLIDAMVAHRPLQAYIPVDVSDGALRSAEANLSARDVVNLRPVVADFERHLDQLPREGRRLLAFLGGTIGNFTPDQRAPFLKSLTESMDAGESFLLGIDLVKDRERLVRAYDDSAGVTAAFNLNVLAVLNRELGADFDLDSFEHVALWDDTNEWIEMRLRSTRDQHVRIAAVDLDLDFTAGEEMRTEISAKFRREGIESELTAVGLSPVDWWTDGDYALILAAKV